MKTLPISIATTFALTLACVVHAQAPSTAPAGTTAQCNDGTWSSDTSERDACASHNGIKMWYGTRDSASRKSATPTTTPAPAQMPPQTFPKPTPQTMPNAQTPTTGTQTGSRPTLPGGVSPAPGGGAGQVWIDSATNMYRCPNDRSYGKTGNGRYMAEADAVAQGIRPAEGKACSS